MLLIGYTSQCIYRRLFSPRLTRWLQGAGLAQKRSELVQVGHLIAYRFERFQGLHVYLIGSLAQVRADTRKCDAECLPIGTLQTAHGLPSSLMLQLPLPGVELGHAAFGAVSPLHLRQGSDLCQYTCSIAIGGSLL
mmetsp:Transcript_21056/g.42698  ORF Transcript_21056/g.42698 Transcript_21056/m.42698 type:complete len:136 (-) Transcript_21056:360-767(-)